MALLVTSLGTYFLVNIVKEILEDFEIKINPVSLESSLTKLQID